jgi:hypothetical protein
MNVMPRAVDEVRLISFSQLSWRVRLGNGRWRISRARLLLHFVRSAALNPFPHSRHVVREFDADGNDPRGPL